MGSWKTSVAGIGAILTIVGGVLVALFDGNAATNPDWAMVIPGLLAAIGLIFSRDNDKSSEQVGAGKK